MTVNVVSFSFSRAAQPEAQGPLCWVLAFFTASYQHLLWTPTHQGPKHLRPGVAFPTTPRLSPSPTVCNSTGTWLPSWLRYIIIQRTHDRLLDLWNRMFNRHQEEITVMQFTGHSLPVHDLEWHFGPGWRSKYYSWLRYVLIIRSFFRLLPWLFSRLGFISMVILSSFQT